MLLAGAIFLFTLVLGYLATQRAGDWLECLTGRNSGIADWRRSSGGYSGGLADSVECDRHLYRRDHHQSSARRIRLL